MYLTAKTRLPYRVNTQEALAQACIDRCRIPLLFQILSTRNVNRNIVQRVEKVP
jgi:hypothetical protein